MKDFDPNAAAQPDSGIFCLPYTCDEAKVVLVPVPWDVTTSYRAGTSGGPQAILNASRQIDLFDVELGKPWLAGIAMAPESPEVRRWNTEGRAIAEPVIAKGGAGGDQELEAAVDIVNAMGAQLNAYVKEQVNGWLAKGKLVGVVGGDHSVPFGAIEAVADQHPGLGVLHIDAHADLRVAYEGFEFSHASILYNVARLPGVGPISQVGIRDFGRAEREFSESTDKIETWFHAQLVWQLAGGATWRKLCEDMVRRLPKDVWITFDVDGLDPALCPNTGTPVPGGLSWDQALVLLRTVGESGRRIVGFDLNEVGNAEWDAIVGARLLYKLAGWALATRL